MSDSYRRPSAETLRWVEETLGPGARVAAVSRLYGGVTAYMDRLTITVADTGRCYDVVLRRWHSGEWFSGVIDREAAALAALTEYAVPAPELLGADRSGVLSGQPCLLMAALDGEPVLDEADFVDCLPKLVRTLVRIHDIDPEGLAPTDPHSPDSDSDRGWIKDRALARAVTQAADQASASSSFVFVHSDYQPFNMLWRGGMLTGVVDWAFAGSGWREIDVGHCRLALAVLFSADVAEMFLGMYEAEAGVRVDPRLDIRAHSTLGRTGSNSYPTNSPDAPTSTSPRCQTASRLYSVSLAPDLSKAAAQRQIGLDPMGCEPYPRGSVVIVAYACAGYGWVLGAGSGCCSGAGVLAGAGLAVRPIAVRWCRCVRVRPGRAVGNRS